MHHTGLNRIYINLTELGNTIFLNNTWLLSIINFARKYLSDVYVKRKFP